MDFLESLLGLNDRRRGGGSILDTLGDLSRWVIGCGCAIVLAIVAGIALLIFGVIRLGEEALVVLVVIGMVLAAVVSLVRISLGGGGDGLA
mgnify:CR=1 FL=1